MQDFEKEWLEFMNKNKVWDSKIGGYRFLKPNEYYDKLKTIDVELIHPDTGEKYMSKECVFDGWVKGPRLFDYCRLCGKNLNEMRENDKKVIRFCCKDHSIEYSKRDKIRKEKFGDIDTSFIWPTDIESIVRTDIKVNIIKNGEHVSFPLEAKKSKWVKNR